MGPEREHKPHVPSALLSLSLPLALSWKPIMSLTMSEDREMPTGNTSGLLMAVGKPSLIQFRPLRSVLIALSLRLSVTLSLPSLSLSRCVSLCLSTSVVTDVAVSRPSRGGAGSHAAASLRASGATHRLTDPQQGQSHCPRLPLLPLRLLGGIL